MESIPIDFTTAYYIKLGRGGEWERDSIKSGKLRLGWKQQTIDDINAGRWDIIEEQLRAKDMGRRVAATTNDFNALRNITESGPENIWITFHQAKLWWTRLASGQVKQDEISKFRLTAQPWSDKATDGRLMVVSHLPGKIAQIQGFRATVCRVKCIDLLRRTLNGIQSPLAVAIANHRSVLADGLAAAIKELHWKDFETLVDLVFRAAGWVRESILGQHEKGYDLVLREPITGDRFVVQVKSRAGIADLQDTIASFSDSDYRRIFFVVHSPEPMLTSAEDTLPTIIQMVGPHQLGELALDAGLSKWLQDKSS